MTREEVIECRLKHTGALTKAAVPADVLREITAAEVDFYIAVGMLEVDEQKNAKERTKDALSGLMLGVSRGKDYFTYVVGPDDAAKFYAALDRAGLKVVEKDA